MSITSFNISRAFRAAEADYQAGRLREAEVLLRQVLSHDPLHAEAINCLGLIACATGHQDEGIALLRRAMEIEPGFYGAHVNLGSALQKARETEAAIASYRQAVALRPGRAEAYCNLAGALRELGRLNEAADTARRAVALGPELVESHSQLALTLQKMCRYEDALASYERALALRPDHPRTRYSLSLLYLLLGHFEKGWDLHESRLAVHKWQFPPSSEERFWDGSDLAGRRVLLLTEQGLGDTIQFIRLVSEVRARNGRVLVRCRRPLRRLLGGQLGIEEVSDDEAPWPAFDVYCPLLSLPRLLQMRIESIPAMVPYLSVDPASAQSWRQRMEKSDGLRIGLAWSGNPRHPHDSERSIPLTALAPLGNVQGVRIFSLQKSAVGQPDSNSIANCKLQIANLPDWTDELHDFTDTAALIANLDLVISCDTAVAHLAGALGKPTWLLLPFDLDWRWLLNRTDSPWYPTMRLFRQPSPGDWSSVISQVCAVLGKGAV